MNNKIKKSLHKIILSLIIGCMVLTGSSTSWSAEPARILIIPFHIYAEKDLSFLQKGIEVMLSSRLTLEGQTIPISKAEAIPVLEPLGKPVTETMALQAAAQTGADYVLLGSLTVFGNSINTDAQFFDVAKRTSLVTFNQAGSSHDDVLQHINLLTGMINDKVFGRQTYAYQSAQPPGASSDARTPVTDSRAHPEKLLAEGRYAEQGFIYQRGRGEGAVTPSWRSRRFNYQINSMAIGDVNGDGHNNIVVATSDTIHIYNYAEGGVMNAAEVKGPSSRNNIWVDVGDFNNNGVDEIFVTNQPQNQHALSSYVLEWNGQMYATVADRQTWYLRVIEEPSRGKVLLGQRKGRGSELFKPGIFELIWNNDELMTADKRGFPKELSIYGFAVGDVMNNGQDMMVAFSSGDYIRLLSPNGDEEWKSPDIYGGSLTHLEYRADDEADQRNKSVHYLKQRIFVFDADQDGQNELLVTKNIDSTGRLLARQRSFKTGRIECLGWDNFGLFPKWQTRDLPKFIGDFAIADLDGDGGKEVVFAVVQKSDWAIRGGKSYIASQQLN